MKSLSLAITLCGLFAFILLAISPVTALPKAYQAVITDNIAHANSITTPEQQVVDIARAPSAVITSVEVQSYTRDYDVTVEEAIRRFELLRLVSALNEQLGKNERTSFGGLWVQHVPEFKVFINLTSGGNQLVQRYTENGPLEGRIQVVEVQRTLDELVLTARSMYDRVSELEVPFDYDISIPRNRVKVYLPHSSLGARRSQFESLVSEFGPDVQLVHVKGLSRRTALTLMGGYKLTDSNGMAVCTSSFTVTHVSSGRKGLITAGHCANSLKYNGKRSLVFQAQAYRNVTPPEPYDVQWHTSSDPLDGYRAYVYIGNGSRAIYGQSPRSYQYVGEYVCKYGITTGASCGTIVGVNFNGTYIRVHSDLVDLSEPRDSGGPWYKDYTAYGIMIGDIEPGNDAYYMAIDYIGILGLRLNTYSN